MGENFTKAKDDIAKILAYSIHQGIFKTRSVKCIEEFIRDNIDSVLSMYGYD